jgi:murein L,D-transpeptidase YcbB/YkuD
MGRTIAPGERAEAVATLRARLAAEGTAPSPEGDPLVYDGALGEAVREFQRRHGLAVDGRVGPATRRELDVSPAERRAQIERVIAERRALPADLGRRFLLVNLSAFTLEAVDSGAVVLTSRVVVGTRSRPTPTLVSSVDGLVVHPFWNVPPRIASEELAPLAERDPARLTLSGIEVFAPGDRARAVEPASVDWDAFANGALELELRQRPGPANPLGVVTMQFPNAENVCLHDTPARELFERARRDLSHGCVRAERADEIARWLVEGVGETAASFESALRDGATVALRLATPVPVYIVDWPAWIDAAGELQLRPEIYRP